MKLGIVGNGMIVGELLTFVHRLHLEEIWLLGREASREKAEQTAAAYHLTGVFYDYEEMLDPKTGIDVVYIALPNHLHYAFTKRALEQKKHVIVEKPAVSNGEELRELGQLAAAQGQMLLEAMTIHHTPSFRALKEDLGRLGEIRLACLNYSQYSSRYQAFQAGNIHPVFDPARSGGSLMDINVYNVHAVLGLFGQPKSARYEANIVRGIDTSGMMFCDYGSFKAVCVGAKDSMAPNHSTIQGDEATILIEKAVNQMTEYRILYHDGQEELRQFGQTEHRMYYEFTEFLRMIEESDHEKHQTLLNLSLAAADLMTTARQVAGIYFKDDRICQTDKSS